MKAIFFANKSDDNTTSKTYLLSPRKRGRKPKHYSEILFELGQRGISITKTRPGEPDPRVSHKVLIFWKYLDDIWEVS